MKFKNSVQVPKLILLIFLILGACTQSPLEDCFLSTGPIRTKKISLPSSPNRIEVFDNIDVTWHKSDSAFIELKAGRNLLDKIEILFDGSKLELRNKAKCNWVRDYSKPIQLHIYSKPPGELLFSGFGEFITADTIKGQSLATLFYGTGKAKMILDLNLLSLDFNTYGNLELFGRSNQADIFAFKEGKLNGLELKVEKLRITLRGLNKLQVWVTESIEGEIESDNILYYKGNPQIRAKAKNMNQFVSKN